MWRYDDEFRWILKAVLRSMLPMLEGAASEPPFVLPGRPMEEDVEDQVDVDDEGEDTGPAWGLGETDLV